MEKIDIRSYEFFKLEYATEEVAELQKIALNMVQELGYNPLGVSTHTCNGFSAYVNVEICTKNESLAREMYLLDKESDIFYGNIKVRISDHYSNLERICGGISSNTISFEVLEDFTNRGVFFAKGAEKRAEEVRKTFIARQEEEKNRQMEIYNKIISQVKEKNALMLQIFSELKVSGVENICMQALPTGGYKKDRVAIGNVGKKNKRKGGKKAYVSWNISSDNIFVSLVSENGTSQEIEVSSTADAVSAILDFVK